MIRAEKMTEGAYVVSAENDSVLLGCPQEILKVFKLKGKEVPDTVVLPKYLYRGGIVQANPEFLTYNSLFIQGKFFKGEKLRIIGEKDQIARIRELLKLCVFGASEEEMISWGALPEAAAEQIRVVRELGLKKPDGSFAEIDDIIDFVEFVNGEAEAGKLRIKNNGDNIFTVSYGEESLPVDLNFYGRQKPVLSIEAVKWPIKRSAFGAVAQSICTTGFDHLGYTTGWMLSINSQFFMVDGTSWTREHLRALGINNSEIKGYILSHIHDDHSAILEEMIGGKRANIITVKDIFNALCKKISLILNWSVDRVKQILDFTEVVAGVPFNLYGAEFKFFRVVHPVSTVGFEVEMEGKKIVYSGDTVWGSKLDELHAKGVISRETYETVDKIPKIDADLTIMDGGGGMIHPRHSELNNLSWERKNRIFLTHCSVIETGVEGLRTIYPGQQWELIPAKCLDLGDVNAIISTPIFKEVGINWLNAVFSRGRIKEVAENDLILKEGFPGRDFYVILSGTFSVTVNGEETAKLGTGDFFGEISIMNSVNCMATVKALSSAKILAIPKAIFMEMIIVTGLAEKLRKIHRLRPIIIQCGWIRDLPPSIINRIVEATEERSYPAGEIILGEREAGGAVFFIRDGRVGVFSGEGANMRQIATFYRGQFFGEIALLEHKLRSATVIAETDVNVLVIKEKDFQELLNEVPFLFYTLG